MQSSPRVGAPGVAWEGDVARHAVCAPRGWWLFVGMHALHGYSEAGRNWGRHGRNLKACRADSLGRSRQKARGMLRRYFGYAMGRKHKARWAANLVEGTRACWVGHD